MNFVKSFGIFIQRCEVRETGLLWSVILWIWIEYLDTLIYLSSDKLSMS